jgi:hypothetical protein
VYVGRQWVRHGSTTPALCRSSIDMHTESPVRRVFCARAFRHPLRFAVRPARRCVQCKALYTDLVAGRGIELLAVTGSGFLVRCVCQFHHPARAALGNFRSCASIDSAKRTTGSPLVYRIRRRQNRSSTSSARRLTSARIAPAAWATRTRSNGSREG